MTERKEPYITAYVIDEGGGKFKRIRNRLETFKSILKCDCIDISERYIKGRIFDFIIDDEGALIDGNEISAFCIDAEEAIAGNLIICGCGSYDGEEHGLTEDETNAITARLIEQAEIERILRQPGERLKLKPRIITYEATTPKTIVNDWRITGKKPAKESK